MGSACSDYCVWDFFFSFWSSHIVIFTQVFVQFLFNLILETMLCIGILQRIAVENLLYEIRISFSLCDILSLWKMRFTFLFYSCFVSVLTQLPFVCVLRVLLLWKRRLVRTSLHRELELSLLRATGCSWGYSWIGKINCVCRK